MGEVDDDVNDEILPPGQKRTRTPKNYAEIFQEFDEELTDNSDEGNDNESDTSLYNDEEANQPDQGVDEFESLLEEVRISSPMNPSAPSTVSRFTSTGYNVKQPVSECCHKEKMSNHVQPQPRTAHPTQIFSTIDICLPPGPWGISIQKIESRCVIMAKNKYASDLLKVNDTIMSLNGIVLNNGDVESWVTLFSTYSSQMKHLVVERTTRAGNVGYVQQPLLESGQEEKKDAL